MNLEEKELLLKEAKVNTIDGCSIEIPSYQVSLLREKSVFWDNCFNGKWGVETKEIDIPMTLYTFCMFQNYIKNSIIPRDIESYENLVEACHYFGVDIDFFSVKTENLFRLDDKDQKIKDDEIVLRKKMLDGYIPNDNDIIIKRLDKNPDRFRLDINEPLNTKVILTEKDKSRKGYKLYTLLKEKNEEKYSLAYNFHGDYGTVNWKNVKKLVSKMKKNLPDIPFALIGGSALRLYERTNLTFDQDLDFTFIGIKEEEFIPSIQKIYEFLRREYTSSFYFMRSNHSITILLTIEKQNKIQSYKLQFIPRLYNSITQVLTGLDIDSCCVAFDGKKFYGTKRFQRCVETNSIIVDPDRQSQSYAFRLHKYMKRGYNIKIPGFYPNKIKVKHTGVGLFKILNALLSPTVKIKSDYENIMETKLMSYLDMAQFIRKILSKARNNKKITIPIIISDTLEDLFGNSTRALRCERDSIEINIISHNVSDFKLITIDPTTQLTDSFHPTSEDWFTDMYL